MAVRTAPKGPHHYWNIPEHSASHGTYTAVIKESLGGKHEIKLQKCDVHCVQRLIIILHFTVYSPYSIELSLQNDLCFSKICPVEAEI